MQQPTTELMNHIKNRNAQTRAWVAEERGRWASTYVEEPEHWAARGILTLDDFRRDQLIANIWDAYKELNGFRPRYLNMDAMSTDDLDAFYADLCEQSRALIAQERKEQARAESYRGENQPDLAHNPFTALAELELTPAG
jgi:hypothetical protein